MLPTKEIILGMLDEIDKLKERIEWLENLTECFSAELKDLHNFKTNLKKNDHRFTQDIKRK